MVCLEKPNILDQQKNALNNVKPNHCSHCGQAVDKSNPRGYRTCQYGCQFCEADGRDGDLHQGLPCARGFGGIWSRNAFAQIIHQTEGPLMQKELRVQYAQNKIFRRGDSAGGFQYDISHLAAAGIPITPLDHPPILLSAQQHHNSREMLNATDQMQSSLAQNTSITTSRPSDPQTVTLSDDPGYHTLPLKVESQSPTRQEPFGTTMTTSHQQIHSQGSAQKGEAKDQQDAHPISGSWFEVSRPPPGTPRFVYLTPRNPNLPQQPIPDQGTASRQANHQGAIRSRRRRSSRFNPLGRTARPATPQRYQSGLSQKQPQSTATSREQAPFVKTPAAPPTTEQQIDELMDKTLCHVACVEGYGIIKFADIPWEEAYAGLKSMATTYAPKSPEKQLEFLRYCREKVENKFGRHELVHSLKNVARERQTAFEKEREYLQQWLQDSAIEAGSVTRPDTVRGDFGARHEQGWSSCSLM